MNAWLRNSAHELASARVVDITQTRKQTQDAAQGRIASLRESGLRLRERACDTLVPRNFREMTPLGHFVPPHVAKVNIFISFLFCIIIFLFIL